MDKGWKRSKGPGRVSLELPPDMVRDEPQSIDDPTQSWSGGGRSVLIDFGAMSDRLDRHDGREEVISGHRARVVEFGDAGTYVFAAHFTDPPVTIVVRTSNPGEQEIARRILKSVAIDDSPKGEL